MGIDMSNYKMIYNDEVFNVISIMPTFDYVEDANKAPKVKFIDATYLNENGELATVNDEAWMFKFIRR